MTVLACAVSLASTMAVRLVVRSSGPATADIAYEFDQQRIAIGRGAGADVRIPHRTVSELHATIRLEGSSYFVVDEGSTNGTRLSGAALVAHRPKLVRSGDSIEIGTLSIAFTSGVAASEPTGAERTSALARRLLREVLDPSGPSAAPPRLVIAEGPQKGQALVIGAPPARAVLGRGETCELVLVDADASREHVEILRDLDGVLARDLGSKNGFFVNERRAREKRLRDRDELLVGATRLVFEDPAEQAVRALDGESDLPVPKLDAPVSGAAASASTPPAAALAPTPAPTETPTPTQEPAPTSTAPPRPPKRSGAGADLLIYVIAALVLAASIAALVVLLRAE